MSAPSERPKCTWLCAGFLLMGFAGVAGTARILWIAIDKVMSGRGLEIYRTAWLVESNYIGVLVLFGALLVTLLIAGSFRLHDWWQWRSLEKKYGSDRSKT